MNMRGIAGEKHAADPIAVGKPCVHRIRRRPGYRSNRNVSPGPFGDQCRQALGGEIDVALQRHRTLHLKESRTGERTEQDLLHLRAEPVPGVTADALQFDICDDRTHTKRLAGKIDTQRVPYQAAPVVGADQVT